MPAKNKISSLLAKDYAPGIFLVRIVLYLVGTGLGIFDTYTDWELVLQFQRNGFNHPLLRLDLNWLRAWYFFAILGTIFTVISISNETIDIFYSMWLFCRKYLRCCRKKHGENWKEINNNTHNVAFEMKERNGHGAARKTQLENEKPAKKEEIDETEDVVITDACRCCYHCGWNFTTRAETIAKFSLWFQDVPMLTLAVLYAFSQSTCKLPEVRDVSGDMFNVGLSALASTAAVAFRLARSMLRLCASIRLRMKSKKDFKKKGKCGKFLSKLLPEKGDAMYPPDTCAQCCIIPFYLVLIFDFVLVFMGCLISLIIWINYFNLKRTPNFDDSLAIFRFQHTGESVHLLNISNNIIPASNGSFVSFETIREVENNEITHCLSEFQYREEDFTIFFNSIEVEAISDQGEFCAVKTGSDVDNSSTYSRCTLYYTFREFVLFYGSTNRITGEITRFDDECIVVKDRFPPVFAGPDLDFNIQVEKTIDRTGHPNATQDLRILYVTRRQNSTALRMVFDVSVAAIVAGGLDVTYSYTFKYGTNSTYIMRFFYDYFTRQFTYNVREVYNYPPPGNGTCTCSSTLAGLSTIRQFLEMGRFRYGYFDTQMGHYKLLQSCSNIPFDKLVPRYDFFRFVSCSYLCGT
jgi:hypothetical protein